jgi:predicted MFS family arabinose efflux permease
MPLSPIFASSDRRQYSIITANYWAFTLTDGALRMLVILHFHHLGYSPLAMAFIFLFYEAFGVVTNLIGGWLGARIGLNRTMNIGLALQIIALTMLLVPTLTIPWIMSAQALSGIAKDLNKMSAKSAIKLLTPTDASQQLYRWVAILTGSKNTLKGIGFFMGSLLLSTIGFSGAISTMATALLLVWSASLILLRHDIGKAKEKPKFSHIFSKSRSINYLSAARCFLFGARDIWFVIALPVYFAEQLAWEHWRIGSFFAAWIIGYGIVQMFTPHITQHIIPTITGMITHANTNPATPTPNGRNAFLWACPLFIIPIAIAVCLSNTAIPHNYILIIGLTLFGILFAINSSVHSFLIVHLAKQDHVSLDVGFYYMANAMGRLIGTVLSGYVFQVHGLQACLFTSAVFIVIAGLCALFMDKKFMKNHTTVKKD